MATFEEKLKQLAVRQQRARKDNRRRKILVGARVLTKVNQGMLENSLLRGRLNSALTCADDRGLVGL